MTVSKRVRITAYVVLGIYSGALFLYGITLPSMLTKVLGFLPLVVVGGFAVFDNWIWKWGPFPRLIKQPVVDGTWHGTLTSYRRNGDGEKVSSEHKVVMVIRQTLTGLSVTLMSLESKSVSEVATVVMKQADDFALHYLYRNDPRMAFRAASPIHAGGSSIEIGGVRPTSLYGEYWTARDSRGSYTLTRVGGAKASTFDEGQQMAARSAA